VRVRLKGSEAFLTLKGRTEGISRLEYEYSIPLEDARSILKNFCSKTIEKERYTIPYHGNTWEVDVFFGNNEGLIIAEIELNHDKEEFEIPSWVGEEVSHDPRYYNSSLLDHSYCDWK
jgi:CYTH domain-containing protein